MNKPLRRPLNPTATARQTPLTVSFAQAIITHIMLLFVPAPAGAAELWGGSPPAPAGSEEAPEGPTHL